MPPELIVRRLWLRVGPTDDQLYTCSR